MKAAITISRFTAKSLWKILFIGIAGCFILFSLLMGLLAFQGMHTVTVNGEYITGMKALFIAPLIGIVLPLLFTPFIWAGMYLSLFLYSKFRTINLEYITKE